MAYLYFKFAKLLEPRQAVLAMTSEKKIPQKKELKEKPIVGGGKVLVMEEKESIRNMLSIMLERFGYESELARDGDEAIELYKQAMASGEPFDVVILFNLRDVLKF